MTRMPYHTGVSISRRTNSLWRKGDGGRCRKCAMKTVRGRFIGHRSLLITRCRGVARRGDALTESSAEGDSALQPHEARPSLGESKLGRCDATMQQIFGPGYRFLDHNSTDFADHDQNPGTGRSNPAPSSEESANHQFLSGGAYHCGRLKCRPPAHQVFCLETVGTGACLASRTRQTGSM